MLVFYYLSVLLLILPFFLFCSCFCSKLREHASRAWSCAIYLPRLLYFYCKTTMDNNKKYYSSTHLCVTKNKKRWFEKRIPVSMSIRPLPPITDLCRLQSPEPTIVLGLLQEYGPTTSVSPPSNYTHSPASFFLMNHWSERLCGRSLITLLTRSKSLQKVSSVSEFLFRNALCLRVYRFFPSH